MRTAGIPYEKIADELNLTPAKARTAVAEALDRADTEPDDVTERIELERLDAMLVGLWKQVTRGDVKAVEQAMRISERRAELLANRTDGQRSSRVADDLERIKTEAMQARPDATIYPIEGAAE